MWCRKLMSILILAITFGAVKRVNELLPKLISSNGISYSLPLSLCLSLYVPLSHFFHYLSHTVPPFNTLSISAFKPFSLPLFPLPFQPTLVHISFPICMLSPSCFINYTHTYVYIERNMPGIYIYIY